MTQNNIIWLLSESTLLLSSTLTSTHGATLMGLPLLCQPRACGSLSGTRKNKATGIPEKNRTTLLQIQKLTMLGNWEKTERKVL